MLAAKRSASDFSIAQGDRVRLGCNDARLSQPDGNTAVLRNGMEATVTRTTRRSLEITLDAEHVSNRTCTAAAHRLCGRRRRLRLHHHLRQSPRCHGRSCAVPPHRPIKQRARVCGTVTRAVLQPHLRRQWCRLARSPSRPAELTRLPLTNNQLRATRAAGWSMGQAPRAGTRNSAKCGRSASGLSDCRECGKDLSKRSPGERNEPGRSIAM
jgi:hypothetical protein